MSRTWTLDEVRALPATTDLTTACEIAYGCGKTKAREMYQAGELDFPAFTCGRKTVVPVAALLELLGDGAAAAEQPNGHEDGPGGSIPTDDVPSMLRASAQLMWRAAELLEQQPTYPAAYPPPSQARDQRKRSRQGGERITDPWENRSVAGPADPATAAPPLHHNNRRQQQ